MHEHLQHDGDPAVIMCRVLLLLVVALAGCESTQIAGSAPVRGPDGTMNWYAITCIRNQADCIQVAGLDCPNGYDLGDSGGQSGTVGAWNRSGGYIAPTYNGHMLVRCKGAGDLTSAQEGAARQLHRELDKQLAAVRRNPKVPELGATAREARTICESERGQFVEGASMGCKVGGIAIFACTLDDRGQANRCDGYFEGGDVVAFRKSMEAQLGPMTGETVEDGFRVFSWDTDQRSIAVTMYTRGVRWKVARPGVSATGGQ
jgi:hypothetical protein